MCQSAQDLDDRLLAQQLQEHYNRSTDETARKRSRMHHSREEYDSSSSDDDGSECGEVSRGTPVYLSVHQDAVCEWEGVLRNSDALVLLGDSMGHLPPSLELVSPGLVRVLDEFGEQFWCEWDGASLCGDGWRLLHSNHSRLRLNRRISIWRLPSAPEPGTLMLCTRSRMQVAQVAVPAVVSVPLTAAAGSAVGSGFELRS